jgi:hypothetical protein
VNVATTRHKLVDPITGIHSLTGSYAGAYSGPIVVAEVATAVPRRAGPVGRTGRALLLTWLSRQ